MWAVGPQEAKATTGSTVSYSGSTLAFKAAVLPLNTVAPAIAGSAADGTALASDAGTWTTLGPTFYTYQWQRCDGGGANCVDLAGATTSTYSRSRTENLAEGTFVNTWHDRSGNGRDLTAAFSSQIP